MNSAEATSGQVDTLLATPDLAHALGTGQFKRFLDQVPIAIAIAEMKESERIVYANPEFEKVAGLFAHGLVGGSWSCLCGRDASKGAERKLGDVIVAASDFIGTFKIDRSDREPAV